MIVGTILPSSFSSSSSRSPPLNWQFRASGVNTRARRRVTENGWNGYIFGSEEIYNPSLAIYQGKLLRVVNVEIYQQRNRTTYSGNSDAGILRVFVHGICACVRAVCVCVCVCVRCAIVCLDELVCVKYPTSAATNLGYSYRRDCFSRRN